MHQHRYIVVNEREGWRIVRGSPRPEQPYPSKREAVYAAITFARRDGYAEAEVLIRHEDGYFASERVDCNSRPAEGCADRAKGWFDSE